MLVIANASMDFWLGVYLKTVPGVPFRKLVLIGVWLLEFENHAGLSLRRCILRSYIFW